MFSALVGGGALHFGINAVSLVFVSLVCFLFIPVMVIMDLEFSSRYYKYLVYMV